jgi:hypothetical protein
MQCIYAFLTSLIKNDNYFRKQHYRVSLLIEDYIYKKMETETLYIAWMDFELKNIK